MKTYDLTIRSTIIDTRVEKFRDEVYNVIVVNFKVRPQARQKPNLRIVK